jgi:methionine aminopeptidase
MTAYKCLQKGIEQVRPGSRYRDIGGALVPEGV